MTSHAKNLSRYVFAQESKLTTLLHQLVRSYPKGVGIIHEFIQNADDAGATKVSIVLDEREHPTWRLPSTTMAQLQGPALVVVNDASFSDDDWERIQSTGRSGKALDASKTGRFGLGFNSVYNVTDRPGILTRDRVGYFDPHGETVDGASRDEPGAAWKLTPELWEECPDLLAPFQQYGLTTGTLAIDHTVFRLPLRAEEVALSSEICDQSFTREDFASLVRKLIAEAGELLLFLKSLTTIDVRVLSPDGRTQDLVTIRTSNDADVAEGRRRVHGQLQADYREMLDFLRTADSEEAISEFEHHVTIERPGEDPVEQAWTVVQALVAGPENALLTASKRMFDFEEKAVPLVGAAALIHATNGPPIDGGRLFCTLPLSSVPSFVPLHINGFFDLQSDRQGIFADEGGDGKAAVRVEWNRALIQYGCSEVAATLLTRIACGVVDPKNLYRYWPSVPDEVRTLLQALPGHVYEQLCNFECMPCGNDGRLFCQPIDVRPLLSLVLEEEEEERIRLTEEQGRLLKGLGRRNRAVISGGSGTGKTLLATTKARDFAEDGKKTLLLCYNRPLANHLAHTIGDQANADVMSFHQLCDWCARSDCLESQVVTMVDLQVFLSRSIALSMVRSLRMHATSATFLRFPRASNCW